MITIPSLLPAMPTYPWHPPLRPPHASNAGRITLISSVGKCLKIALDELAFGEKVAAARSHSSASNYLDGSDCDGGERSFELSDKKRKYRGGSAERDSNQQNHGLLQPNDLTSNNSNFRLDDSLSEAILGAYSKAVTETKFDDQSKTARIVQSNNPTANAAPAAILRGEVEHFNRVAGQWRIVVKNAALKERSTTKVDNGMSGRSLRKRTVLDWDAFDGGGDDCNPRRKKSKEVTDEKRNVHHFQGRIQILAYDVTD